MAHHSRIRLALLSLGFILLFSLGVPTHPALAQGAARVILSPASATVGEGQTAAVQVRVENVQDLYGLDIRLQFDPNALEVVDEYPQQGGVQMRPGDLLSVDFIIRNTANNEEGTLWYALTQVNPSTPVSGSGVAFTILFRGKRAGLTSPLTFTNCQLATRAGTFIPATAEDGEVRVVQVQEAPPTPTTAPPPPEPTIRMPTPTPTPRSTPSPTLAANTATPTPTQAVTPTAVSAQPTAPAKPTGVSTQPTFPATPTSLATTAPAALPQATPAQPTAAATIAAPPTEAPTAMTLPIPTIGLGMTPKQGTSRGLSPSLIIAGAVGILLVVLIILGASRRDKGDTQ